MPTHTLPKKSTIGLFVVAAALLGGCSSKPVVSTERGTGATTQAASHGPGVRPPAFKVFHQDASTFTLVTREDATGDEIAALIFELRNAAHTQGFDALHISQKVVDARDPYAWFHIYRGAKCAAEKYVPKPPCGASYHAAGDYTFGGTKRKDWDDGILYAADGNETHLWNPDVPYTPTH